MKRSEIDRAAADLAEFAADHGFRLPPWADWSPHRWAATGPEADEIRRCGLGWDVTDFGGGDFASLGLTLFTIRNGPPDAPAGAKDYCEKIMLVRHEQITPCHFHFDKMEDIINRAGGRLIVKLNHAADDESLDESSDVAVQVDGITRLFPAGGELALSPGESVTLPPKLYHSFWGDGTVLVGEVSRVNDDAHDNRFVDRLPRFPAIEEDAPARYTLCTEYASAP